MLREVFELVERQAPFASIDIHNNSGRNPHYACVSRLDDRHLHLARLFIRTVVYFERPAGVQSAALARLCPAVVAECGRAGEPSGIEHAAQLIEAALAPGEYPETGRATVTCAGASSLYTFATRVLSIEFAEHRRMHLTIRFPDRITKRERRRHVRVQPLATHPVGVRIVMSNGEVVDVEPVDISSGGISFMMTEEVSRFKPGDAIELTVGVPMFGDVSARAVIRNVIHLMDLTRIGVEFSFLSDDARKTIMEYVAEREKQMRQGSFEDD